MATIKNFEELDSWKKARELAGRVYGLTRKEKFARDFGLRDQIQRAAGSVMHNIAEGFESGTDPEFVRFLTPSRSGVPTGKWHAGPQAKSNLNCILLLIVVILRLMSLRKTMTLRSKSKCLSMA